MRDLHTSRLKLHHGHGHGHGIVKRDRAIARAPNPANLFSSPSTVPVPCRLGFTLSSVDWQLAVGRGKDNPKWSETSQR